MLARKRLAIGLGALVLILASLFVVGTALADDPPPTATSTTGKVDYRQVFVEKLAAALGVDVATLQAKVKDAAKGTVDQAVADGNLARNPAEEMKKAIDNGRNPFIGGLGKARVKAPPAPKAIAADRIIAQVSGVAQKAIAEKLGVELGVLRQQIRSGQSLAELAQAKGLTVQDLYNAAADAVKARLDPFVKDGRLAQARADDTVQAVREGRLINLDFLPKAAPKAAPARAVKGQ
jgi:hypothetical protein